MSRLISLGKDYIQLNDDNTYVTHKTQFVSQDSHALRIDRDAQDKETVTLVPEKVLISYDSITGDIKSEQSGFDPHFELIGIPLNPNIGQEYSHKLKSDFPPDFEAIDPVTKDRTIKYKIDTVTKEFKLKV